ncbi:hypothetical protein MPTK1_3g24430 [Marchantia polymorpha subsp. ruderalis]|uniref:Uncharacterized protein n=2 Tax=Marchantia polymorpha TaxID=3197 RepID=A0AAF6B4C3_MARPO|nr:hypothetical protein MARPO_0178s0011 [Marchantia polymorpha]BBN06857.1 hypothetical protein Mp_3g24430 [Marchantia polymorpha subsp. ruderalis]|eukprot:PTQ27959.1 hypothetical protein MARPO_0178s0011 [Marchantia polymorpha]
MKTTHGVLMKAVLILISAMCFSAVSSAVNYQSPVDNLSNAEFGIRLNDASSLLASATLPGGTSTTIYYTVPAPVSTVNWNFTAVVGNAGTKQNLVIAIEPDAKVNITNYSPRTYVINVYSIASGNYELANSVTWLG